MTSVDLKLDTFSIVIKVTSFANECGKETTDQTENVTTKAMRPEQRLALDWWAERRVHLEPENNFATKLSSGFFSSAPPFRSRCNQQVD